MIFTDTIIYIFDATFTHIAILYEIIVVEAQLCLTQIPWRRGEVEGRGEGEGGGRGWGVGELYLLHRKSIFLAPS